jgi:serine/threonine protein phosphatase 1
MSEGSEGIVMIRKAAMNQSTENSASVNTPGRLIAIGDIHGCSAALEQLLGQILPTPTDTIVTIGDYIDRGPDSKGVLDRLLTLKRQCRLIMLLGNHEQMLFSARSSHEMFQRWQNYGGAETLASYHADDLHGMPVEHHWLLDSCRLHYETDTHFFIHANYDPRLPLSEQNEDTALSLSLFERIPGTHMSGKTAIVGHTEQKSGQILDLGYLKCIDTNCHGGGYLTALEVQTGQVWQVAEAQATPAASTAKAPVAATS